MGETNLIDKGKIYKDDMKLKIKTESRLNPTIKPNT